MRARLCCKNIALTYSVIQVKVKKYFAVLQKVSTFAPAFERKKA
jgi:hypothetical protein